jgi:hypothetical protein
LPVIFGKRLPDNEVGLVMRIRLFVAWQGVYCCNCTSCASGNAAPRACSSASRVTNGKPLRHGAAVLLHKRVNNSPTHSAQATLGLGTVVRALQQPSFRCQQGDPLTATACVLRQLLCWQLAFIRVDKSGGHRSGARDLPARRWLCSRYISPRRFVFTVVSSVAAVSHSAALMSLCTSRSQVLPCVRHAE